MTIEINMNDQTLTAVEFCELFSRNWGVELDHEPTRQALTRSVCVTARQHGRLVACLRLISDGYLSTSVSEYMIDPECKEHGICKRLLAAAYDAAPSGISFAVQNAPPRLMQELGWSPGPQSWFKRKQITRSDLS